MADHATLDWSDIGIRSLVVHGGLFFHLREGARVGEISIFTPIQKGRQQLALGIVIQLIV